MGEIHPEGAVQPTMIIQLAPSSNLYDEIILVEWIYWIKREKNGVSYVYGSDRGKVQREGFSVLEEFLTAIEPGTSYRYWFNLTAYNASFYLTYAGNRDKCKKYQVNPKAEIDHTSAESWIRSIQQTIFNHAVKVEATLSTPLKEELHLP